MVSYFRMGVINPTIELAIENNSTADSGANRDVDETALAFTRSPSSFPESGGVSIVLHCHGYLKFVREVRDWVAALPARKEVHVSNGSGEGINRPSAPDADPKDLSLGRFRRLSQHIHNAGEGMAKSASRIGGRLKLCQHVAAAINHADCDFCAADVHRSYHALLQSAFKSQKTLIDLISESQSIATMAPNPITKAA
jgi:hypothetical protein